MKQKPLTPTVLSLQEATMAQIVEELDARNKPYLMIWCDLRNRWYFGLNGDDEPNELLTRITYMRDKLMEFMDEMEG